MYANFRKITVELECEPVTPYTSECSAFTKSHMLKCRQDTLFALLSGVWSSGDQMPALKAQIHIHTRQLQ